MQKILLYKMSYFPQHTHSKNEIKINLNFSIYATKSDLKTQEVLKYQNFLKTLWFS